MSNTFWEALGGLSTGGVCLFFLALAIAFAFEFINGFHDTANAVTTVIYTRTLKPTPAVLFSGLMNFLGVLLGGTAVAFSIVNLLPVDLLVEGNSARSIAMVLALLLAGVIWNLGTWYVGLPVSSSHTLIGSILGVGLANSLLTRGNLSGINWSKAGDVGIALLVSPLLGFLGAGLLLLLMKRLVPDPRLYLPPADGDSPPGWIRGVLLATCGGVSFAHGSNDGQKGMGLILLSLIGFLPSYYALDLRHPQLAIEVRQAASEITRELPADDPQTPRLQTDLARIEELLGPHSDLSQVPPADRWEVRQSILRFRQQLGRVPWEPATRQRLQPFLQTLSHSIEYVPVWVVMGVAIALGVGTTVGYRRIVVTVAEKIGKAHLTYAQGAAAELIAALTIGLADRLHLPASTTQVLSSGVAGTMWANRSGIQNGTVRRILIAWLLTLPAAITLGGVLFLLGGWLLGGL